MAMFDNMNMNTEYDGVVVQPLSQETMGALGASASVDPDELTEAIAAAMASTEVERTFCFFVERTFALLDKRFAEQDGLIAAFIQDLAAAAAEARRDASPEPPESDGT